jgi:flavin reductase (DIM6/NTAB) family NADH-FMN oxidoreductase RutF
MTADSAATETHGGSPATSAKAFREAMRHLPAGVCVISVGAGAERSGMTATSVSSLSIEPPTLLVSVNRSSSSYGALTRHPAFGVNVLAAGHHAVADAFAGRDGEQGGNRYAAGRWITLSSGVRVLRDAVAAFDCEVEERIERHTHAIVIGRVRGLIAPGGPSALLYWRGQYDQLGWTEEEISRAVGLRPAAPRPVSLASDSGAAHPAAVPRLRQVGRP